MLRDLEAFLRYVTLIAVRLYLLTYLLYGFENPRLPWFYETQVTF